MAEGTRFPITAVCTHDICNFNYTASFDIKT